MMPSNAQGQASPQIEDGFTRIANEYLEEFVRWDYPASVMRFVLIVIRETWGYRRQQAAIPASRFEELLGVSRARVYQIRLDALRHNLITIDNLNPGTTAVYSVQKRHTDWIVWRSRRSFEVSVKERLDTRAKDRLDTSVKERLDTGEEASVKVPLDAECQDAPLHSTVKERKESTTPPPTPPAGGDDQGLRALLAQHGQTTQRLIRRWLDHRHVSGPAALQEAGGLVGLLDHYGMERWEYAVEQGLQYEAQTLAYVDKVCENYDPARAQAKAWGPTRRGGDGPFYPAPRPDEYELDELDERGEVL